MIFDGRKNAELLSDVLLGQFKSLENRVNLVIFQVGQDKASELFINLKVKKSLELGVSVEHIRLGEGEYDKLEQMMNDRSLDSQVDGFMLQLPAICIEKSKVAQLLGSIPKDKDVDGLNPESGVTSAVIRAVGIAYDEYEKQQGRPQKVVVVGAKGNLGSQLVDFFVNKQLTVLGIDQDEGDEILGEADLVVLSTGVAGVVKEEKLKPGAGVIDLGAPMPEFEDMKLERVGFLTPVPGGIGPMTVISLFENLRDLVFERRGAKI